MFEYSNDLPGKDLRMKLKSTVVRKHRVGTEDNLKDSVICFQKHSRYELSSNNARCFISEIQIKIQLNKYASNFWCLLLHIRTTTGKRGYLEIQFRSIDAKSLSFSSIWSSLIIQDGPILPAKKEFYVTIYNFGVCFSFLLL